MPTAGFLFWSRCCRRRMAVFSAHTPYTLSVADDAICSSVYMCRAALARNMLHSATNIIASEPQMRAHICISGSNCCIRVIATKLGAKLINDCALSTWSCRVTQNQSFSACRQSPVDIPVAIGAAPSTSHAVNTTVINFDSPLWQRINSIWLLFGES